jgi:hypothetical protein
MSYRIAISFAAAAIGSCIATEAIAQEAAGFAGAAAKKQVQQLERERKKAPAGFSGAAAKQVQHLEREKREKQQQLDRELPARAAAGFGGAVAPQMQEGERKEKAKLEAKARAEAAQWERKQELEAKARAETAELESTAKAAAGFAGAAAPQMQQLEDEKLRAPAGFAGAAAPQAGATGGAYYAPASDNGNGTACGRFPFPPCKKVGE